MKRKEWKRPLCSHGFTPLPKEKKMNTKEEHALLTFLQRTKEGKYAKIDEGSLVYTRIKVQQEEIYDDEEYLYSLR